MKEELILSNLLYNEDYTRKVLPYLKSDYFSDRTHKTVYETLNAYIQKYNARPSKEALLIELNNIEEIEEEPFNQIVKCVDNLKITDDTIDWLVETTEKHCQDKAIYNAIHQSIKIMDGSESKLSKTSIPSILSDALSVSFDNHIGHDYIEDSDNRFNYYHKNESKIPFDIELLNSVTLGGLPDKTLNIVLAPPHAGKTRFMTHCAAYNLSMGYNVLYITLEMAEEEISRRIDANLLNVPMDEIPIMPKSVFQKKIDKVRGKGKLIIKEFPTAGAGAGHFRHLIEELKIKKNFKPDIIYIDYLNICISSRIKPGSNVNSYTYMKSVAEELRGLAVEYCLPIVTATQTNRSGGKSSDLEFEDVSESYGLPMTADFMIALIRTEELDDLNQVLMKQLKNRYSDKNNMLRFVIGVDNQKMRHYDVEQHAQDGLYGGQKDDDKPVMDKTHFGQRDDEVEFAAALRRGKQRKNTDGFK